MDRTLALPTSVEANSLTSTGRLDAVETLNQWTHGFGCVLSLAGSLVMLRLVGMHWDVWRAVGCVIYLASLVGVYGASTLSHSFAPGDPRRTRFRMLDQVCIFLHIVGAFTPFALMHLEAGTCAVLLAIMWSIALIGCFARTRTGDQSLPTVWFVGLGWMPFLALPRAWEISGLAGVLLIVLGGGMYLGGTWFLANDHRRPYYHATWHLMVITGSALHYCYLLQYVAQPLA